MKLYVKDFGAAGDGVTDDSTPIQAALNAAAMLGGVLAFDTRIYKVNSALTRSNAVDIEGNGATLNMAGAPSSATLLTVNGPKRNSFCEYLSIIGPTGMSVALKCTTAGGAYRSVYIFNVGTGIVLGADNTYLLTFDDVHVTGYAIAGFSCVSGLTNSGENVRWFGGGIYNGAPGAVGIDNQGCEFNGVGMSIDFPGDSFIRCVTSGPSGPGKGTATVQLANCHLETRGVFPNGDPAIDIGAGPGLAGQNAWSHVIIRDSAIINDTGGAGPVFVRNNGTGAWAVIADSQLTGWTLPPTGIGAVRVSFSNYTDGLTPFQKLGPQ